MKHLYIFLFSVILLNASCIQKQQYFNGQIEYKYTYEGDSINIDSLTRLKPHKSIFLFDNNNYQSKFIGQDSFTYYYNGTLNKCITETNSNKDYACEDYGIPTDSIISFKTYDTDEKVLGFQCKIIEFQAKRFWNKYFVSTDLIIAPGTYNKHVSYNWKYCNEKTGGGLILKSEHRFKNYTMKGVITAINQHDNNFHAVPFDEKTISAICKSNK